jgi:RimJ/RimL family protein N-acetyltransferase
MVDEQERTGIACFGLGSRRARMDANPTGGEGGSTVKNVENLDTKRLILEPWHARHRAPWRRICRDPEVMRSIGAGEVWAAEKADEVFDRALEHWESHGFGWRSALDKTTREWLGFAGLNYVGPGTDGVAPEEVEIGWWIIRERWGRGYASEGAAALRNEGFARVGLVRMIARLQPANTASARVAEKIGMSFEREAAGRAGERLVIYALSRDAWERLVWRAGSVGVPAPP